MDIHLGWVASREISSSLDSTKVPWFPQRGGVIMCWAVGGSQHNSPAWPRKHARPDSSPNSVSLSMSLSHEDVDGVDFWRDGGALAGQIVHRTRRESMRLQITMPDGTIDQIAVDHGAEVTRQRPGGAAEPWASLK